MAPLLLLKATLLLGGALAGARLLQRSAAATRHRFWSLAFAALLALPPLALALPALYVPLPAWWQSAPASLDALVTPRGDSSPAVAESRAVTRVEGATAAAASGARPAVTPATFRARVNVSRVIGAILLTAWIGGTIACLSALLLSVWRVVRLS